MASSREEAKSAVTGSASNDAELDTVLDAASKTQVDILKEKNRHAEANAAGERGLLGKLFGGNDSAPVFIASVAMIIGLVGAGICLAFGATKDEALADYWQLNFERAIAFASAALAFIFGKSKSK